MISPGVLRLLVSKLLCEFEHRRAITVVLLPQAEHSALDVAITNAADPSNDGLAGKAVPEEAAFQSILRYFCSVGMTLFFTKTSGEKTIFNLNISLGCRIAGKRETNACWLLG